MSEKINLSINEMFLQANELLKSKKFISAKKLYLEVIKKDIKNIKALNNIGIIYLNIGKLNYAVKYFKSVVNIDDKYKDGYNNLGLAYKSLNNFSEALNSFVKCIEIDPQYFQAYNNIGQVHYENERYEDAINNFKIAIKINSNLYFAFNNIGQVYVKKGEFNKAIINFKEAIKLNPNYFEAFKNIGQVFFECGEYNNALISFKNALKINSKKKEIYCLIGLTYEKIGNVELALKNYSNVPKEDLNFEYAQFNYASLLYKNKQFSEALKIFKQLNYNKSNSYLLKCLYELNLEKELLTKLDEEINNRTANAIIGSIINSTNFKFGTKKKNTFCENPFNYLLNINLKKDYNFEKIFVNTTNNFFNDQDVKNRPQPLLIKGAQSAGNFFNYKNDNVNEIKKIIYKYLKKYHSIHKESKDGIIKNWPKNFELIGWLVKMKSGGSIKPHIHDHGWLSGSIYINVPKKKNNNGNLVVSISDQKSLIECDDYFINKRIINVETGSFCLFPSSLFHYTIPFESESNRIVLAFDVIAK